MSVDSQPQTITVAITSGPQETASSGEAHKYATQLASSLALHGLAVNLMDSRRTVADVSPNESPGDVVMRCSAQRRRDLKSRREWAAGSTLFVPVIHEGWFTNEAALLELYFALRTALVTGKPLFLPVLDAKLLGVVANIAEKQQGTHGAPPSRPISSASTSNKADATFSLLQAAATAAGKTGGLLRRSADSAGKIIPWLCEACDTVTTSTSPQDAAVLMVNYLSSMGLQLPTTTVSAGFSLLEVYKVAASQISAHRPNSGVTSALSSLPVAAPKVASLTTLSLKHLFISEAGTKALLPVIRMLPGLEVLDLSGNGINNAAVHVLCDTLAEHPAIAEVNLSDNEITQAGATDVYFMVQTNPRLRSVDISQNPIHGTVWQKRIANLVQQNAHFGSARSREVASVPRSSAEDLEKAMQHRITLHANCTLSDSDEVGFELRSASSRDPIVIQGLKEELTPAIMSYLKTHVAVNILRVQRQNKSQLFLVLEQDPIANRPSEATVLPSCEGISRAIAFRTAQRMPLLFKNSEASGGTSLVDVVIRIGLDSAQIAKEATGVATPFFIECQLTFETRKAPTFGVRPVGRSVPQLFRGNIIRCSGNVTEEVSVLLEELSAVVRGGTSTLLEEDGGAEGDLAQAPLTGAILAHSEDAREAAKENEAVERAVLSQFRQ